MILRIIRWILGYITFKTESKNSKLFLNLAAKSKIQIWNINKIGKILYANINSSEYGQLCNLVRKNNIKLEIIQKKGLPFFYTKNKHRKGLLFGVIIFFAIIKLLSLFIWKINISKDTIVDEKRILEAAKTNGIFVGQIKKNINAKAIAQKIMDNMPQISWVSINIEGCVANISIKQQIDKPKIENDYKPKDVIALCDAQIFRMETFSGTPMVHVGDTVLKGQILVSRFIKDKDGKMNETCAKSNVWAKVQDEISLFEKFEQTTKIRTGNTEKIFKLNLFNKNLVINFWQNPNTSWDIQTKKNYINFFGIKIPTGITTEEFYETNQIKVIKTKQEIIDELRPKIYEILKSKNLEIERCSEQISESKNGISVKLKFEYIKNIAT